MGGLASPLLANVYLHELDLYMAGRIRDFDRGTTRRRNPAYRRLEGRGYHARTRANELRAAGQEAEAREYIALYDTLREERLRTPAADSMDPGYRRLRYIRYADDFLIGVIGSKAEACQVMQEITRFLADTLHLTVSPVKSGVRAGREGVRFLGYDIYTYTGARVVTVNRDGRNVTQRTMVERLQLAVPYEKVRKFAADRCYGNLNTREAKHRTSILTNDDAEIVQVYNAELRGFANYYALAWDVKRKLGKLAFLWSTSLFKTLANRHRSSQGCSTLTNSGE